MSFELHDKKPPLSNSKLLLRTWMSRHRVALQTQTYLKTGPQDSVLPVLLQVEPNKRAQAPPAETLMGKDRGAPGACRSSLMSTLHVDPDLETLSCHGDRGIQGDHKSGRDVVRQCSCLGAGRSGQDGLQREGRCCPSEELGGFPLWGGAAEPTVHLWASPSWLGAPGDAVGPTPGLLGRTVPGEGLAGSRTQPSEDCSVGRESQGSPGSQKPQWGAVMPHPPRADWAMEGGRCITKVGRALTLNPSPLA